MLRSSLLAAGFLAAGLTHAAAACTEAAAGDKATELSSLVGTRLAPAAALTQELTSGMQALLTTPTTEATCTGFDRLIARARAGR